MDKSPFCQHILTKAHHKQTLPVTIYEIQEFQLRILKLHEEIATPIPKQSREMSGLQNLRIARPSCGKTKVHELMTKQK